MAKINIVSRALPAYYQAKIHVLDPDCVWNIKPECTVLKVFKASSAQKAKEAIKKYCKNRMQAYANTKFTCDWNSIEPYFYHEHHVEPCQD